MKIFQMRNYNTSPIPQYGPKMKYDQKTNLSEFCNMFYFGAHICCHPKYTYKAQHVFKMSIIPELSKSELQCKFELIFGYQ